MNNPNLIKTSLHYGALSGIAVFLFFIGLYFSNINVFGPLTTLGVWIPVVFIVIATKFHRSQNLNGSMTYGQGLLIGISTTLFSSALFGLSFYLFGSLVAPELLELYRSQAAQSLEEGKSLLSESLMDKAMDSIELVTLSSLAFSESFNKVVWGTVISLITAAVYKKSNVVPD